MAAAAPLARDGRFFGRAINTGSHKASMELVASSQANIAAIDLVTWRMSRRFDFLSGGPESNRHDRSNTRPAFHPSPRQSRANSFRRGCAWN